MDRGCPVVPLVSDVDVIAMGPLTHHMYLLIIVFAPGGKALY